MAMTTPLSNNSDVRPVDEPLRVPPDETIWKRYSPHHEAPLSFVGSVALHALVLGLLVVYGVLMFMWFKSQPKPLPIDTIRMPGGGGGDPKGKGDAPGVGTGGRE